MVVAAGLVLTACTNTENGDTEHPTTAAFANVRAHLPGARALNVECPDGTWSPLDRAGNPVAVRNENGADAFRVDIKIGETVTITDQLTGKDIDLICVPEFLPEFGDDWIGEWVGMGLVTTRPWRSALQMFIAGFATNWRVHEIVIDPYGVIRSYRLVVGLPSAVEQDPVTSGLISHMHGDQRIPPGSEEPWPLPGAAAPGTPPEDSYIAIRSTRPDNDGVEKPGLRLKPPTPGIRLDGHDFVVTADGNYLVIGYELVEEPGDGLVPPLTAPNACMKRRSGEPVTTLRTRILEYRRDGSVAKIWRSEDHLPAGISPAIGFGIFEIDGERVCVYDIEHANALDIDDRGRVVVGMRNALTPAVLIDWRSGEVLWTLGGDGPNALDVEDDPYDGPLASHDATLMLENGRTVLAILDNNSRRGTPRYVRYIIDEEQRTATLFVQIPLTCREGTCYSLLGGSSQVFRGEGTEAEMLITLGGNVAEDVTVPLDGQLLHYRGGTLVSIIPLGPWWPYRATVYREEPWSRSGNQGN
jgi:hypothetical protein